MKLLTLSAHRIFLAAVFLISVVRVFSQSRPLTVIEGRVLNVAAGTFLENARVVVSGTRLEAMTGDTGVYRIANIPTGSVSITVFYSEFVPQTKTVSINPGQTVQLDFALELAQSAESTGNIVRLAEYSVLERRLSGQALALNEERVASNIKNVIAFEEFGDMGESNPGEYLKYVPGLSINYGPNIPQFASVRGLPAEGTLVMMDGGPVASSAGDRAFELTGAATSNVDRIEVTKSPTPDMPANAIGGSINIVGRSGFSRKSPQLTYSAYTTFNQVSGRPGLKPSLGKRTGPDPRTDGRTVSPGFELVYLKPVNEKFAFTLSAGAGTRYNYYDSIQTLWNLATNIDERLIKQDVIVISDRKMAGFTADWRITKQDTLRASFQYSEEAFRVSVSAMDYRYGASASGDETFTQSRPGLGVVANTASAYNSFRDTASLGLRYAHSGPLWKYDADVSYSRSGRENSDSKDGTFSGFTATYTGLTMRGEGRNNVYGGALPRITATNAAGQPVNIHDAGGMPITGATAAVGLLTDDVIRGARLNLARELDTRNPLRLKTGASVYEERLDMNRSSQTYTFAAPAGPGSNTGNALGVMSDAFSDQTQWYDHLGNRVPVRWISPAKLYDYFLANPRLFTLNEAASYTAMVNNSKYLKETILAGYVSAESKTFENRLRIVTGVRYERTNDDGSGPLNDIGATYSRNASGEILRTPAGAPVRITTDPLALALAQYTRRGTENERTYDDFYPSLNGSFQIRDNLVMRFAFAETISRPPIREITPGIVLPNPTATAGIISLNNTGLMPWRSHNFDVTLEAYDVKGATLSAGVFQKNISSFFISTTNPATQDFLDEYGLGSEYAGYDVVTKRNGGDARLTGIEFSYRQALRFLPNWARGAHIFVNGTFLSLSGTNADDFTGFTPQNVNWGVSYARQRIVAKVNVSQAGRVRSLRVAPSATVPANTYRYVAPQTTVDASAEYKFSRRLALYASARNATQSVKYTEDFAPTTPEYAHVRVAQRFGAMVTVGMKGEF